MNGMNFSPDQMRMASEMMKNMKDDDIKRMMGMMGGPSIDPSLLRNFASQMGGGSPTPPPQRSQQNEYTPPPAPKKEEPKPPAEPEPTPKFNPYEKIEKIKNRGNKLYEAQRYKEACQLYFEGIMEVEDMFDNGVKRNPEITAIELSCRRNYALGKMAQKEFRDAHNMLEEVLKIAPEDPKALIKISECSLELGQPQAAGAYLEKCRSQLQGEEQWKSLQKRVLVDFPASDLKASTETSSPSTLPNVIQLGSQSNSAPVDDNSQVPVEVGGEQGPSQDNSEPEKQNPSPPKKKKVKRDNESVITTALPKATPAPAKQPQPKEPEPSPVAPKVSDTPAAPTPVKLETTEPVAPSPQVATGPKVEPVSRPIEESTKKEVQAPTVTPHVAQSSPEPEKPKPQPHLEKPENREVKPEPVKPAPASVKVEPKVTEMKETPKSTIAEPIPAKAEPPAEKTPAKPAETSEKSKPEPQPKPAVPTTVEPAPQPQTPSPAAQTPQVTPQPTATPSNPEPPAPAAPKTPESSTPAAKPQPAEPQTPETAKISTEIASNQAVYYAFLLANYWQLVVGLLLGYLLGKLL